ncbi:S8 family serine peptidase [Neptunicella sp. SCSIO 80796]|uniref:S8 family serine peptidase n=1 Tax=Neptunicella plasticusilytica TaxID=3117012 RepID=UPI003A4D806D
MSYGQSEQRVTTSLSTKPSHNKYIVELKEQSISQKLAARKGARSSKTVSNFKARVNAEQTEFKTAIQQQFQNQVTVGRQFQQLLNAVVISAEPSQIETLSKFQSVKRIYKEVRHRITSVEDVTDYNVINVNQLRISQLAESDIDGKGIKVAIVDTGVDYTHPDLGGCFGPECKVYGGYDFVNKDEDPFDDESHGTHVAGIVAANGNLKGIAPAANLLAIKVCGEQGYCYNSDIIAGLEFALDPDGEPSTDDGADIVNMSLGSTSEDSALTNAVNHLVDMGITVVVSAGNDGPNDNTFSSASKNLIGSPADSEKAITVAASVGGQSIADFSTRGYPSSGAEILKPEVAAPGVSIKSTIPGGGYANYSGTSMSSPMVAGVVALLKQIAPERTPEQLKAALMSTAKPIENDIRSEGAGLIDALAAAELPVNFSIPVLHFGAVDFSLENMNVSLPLTIENPGSESLNLTLDFDNVSDTALTFSSSDYELTIPAGQSETIDINLSLDTNTIPLSVNSPAIGAMVKLNIGEQTYRIPAVIFHRSYIDITFTDYLQNYADLYFRGNKTDSWQDIWSPEWLSGQTKRIFLAPGIYNLFTDAAQKSESDGTNIAFLYYGDLVLEKSLSLEVSPADAKNLLVFNVENALGKKISGDTGLTGGDEADFGRTQFRFSIFDKTTGDFVKNNILGLQSGEERTVALSNFPEGYVFNVFSDFHNEKYSEVTHFSYQFESPITNDIDIDIQEQDYQSVYLDFNTSAVTQSPLIMPWVYDQGNIYDDTDRVGSASTYPFESITEGLTYYLTPLNTTSHYTYFSSQINQQNSGNVETPMFISPQFKINQNKKLALYNFYNNQLIKEYDVQQEYKLTVGKLLPFWTAGIRKNQYGDFVYSFVENDKLAFYQDSDFSYWLGKIVFNTNNIESTVYNRYVRLLSGGNTQDLQLPVQQGKVVTDIVFNDYIVEGRSSRISTQLNFDLDNVDYAPPVIQDLRISSLNKATQQLQCGGGIISFEFADGIEGKDFQLSIRPSKQSEWLVQGTVNQNEQNIAVLSDLEPGFYDLSLSAVNASGNSMDYKAEPAFHVAKNEVRENDKDCDGVDNGMDVFPLDPLETMDSDGDGIGNNADSDDDNDGVLDENDVFPLDPEETSDFDQDGIGDNADTDDDNDGQLDTEDAFPFDSSEILDTDKDGIGNNADTDDDNDGVVDSADAFPLDKSRYKQSSQVSSAKSGSGSFEWIILFILVATTTARMRFFRKIQH